jgi:hypothetical protein
LDGHQVGNVTKDENGYVTVCQPVLGAGIFTAGGGHIQYSLPSIINQRPALRFLQAAPEISTYLQIPNLNLAPDNVMTLFLVMCRASQGVTGNEEIFSVNDIGVTNSWQTFDLFGTHKGALNYNVGSDGAIASTYDLSSNTPVLISMAISSDKVNLFTTGSPAITDGARTNPPTNGTPYNLNANHTWRISGGALLGDIGEIIVYPSVLSGTDRQRIEGFLAWKWGMQSSLPSTHPYYGNPPIPSHPNAPTNVHAAAGNGSVTVSFDVPIVNIGSPPITGYILTSVKPDSSIVYRVSSSPIIVTGLTAGVTYSFTVTATTSYGQSDPSAPSEEVTVLGSLPGPGPLPGP